MLSESWQVLPSSQSPSVSHQSTQTPLVLRVQPSAHPEGLGCLAEGGFLAGALAVGAALAEGAEAGVVAAAVCVATGGGSCAAALSLLQALNTKHTTPMAETLVMLTPSIPSLSDKSSEVIAVSVLILSLTT